MSSSKRGAINRKGRWHRAASTSPTTMTRCGNLGVEKNSRMASKYATPATARGMKNDGSPVRLKLREQIVSATSKMAPSPYSLCEGVSFTGLPYKHQVVRLLPAIRQTSLQSLGPSRERAAIPEPAESSLLGRRCHRRVP